MAVLFWSAVLYQSVSFAALPEKAQVVQAEAMTLSGEGWTVREHSPDAWYSGRPVGQMLGGQNNKPGTAAATIQIPAAGKYRIWVRYLDMVDPRSKSGFLLLGTQKDKQVAQKEFDNKVRMLPEQKEPVVVHFRGRRPFSPWYTPHANINQKGIFLGVSTGSEDKPGIRMAAGEESVWVNISPYLAYGGLNQISLYAMRSYHEPEPEAYFEISFSKTPSEAGLLQKAERKGTGDGFIFAVDLVDYRLITETEGSKASLRMAQATPVVSGKLPTGFPFFTGMSLTPQRSTAQAVANEREALRLIGIGSDKKRPSNFYFHMTKSPGCLSRPKREQIDESMKDLAAKNPDRTGWTMINLMDEPGLGMEHVESCPACQEGFVPYLKSLGLRDSEIARLKINNHPEGAGPGEKASYYYTRRYMNHIMTEMHRAGRRVERERSNG